MASIRKGTEGRIEQWRSSVIRISSVLLELKFQSRAYKKKRLARSYVAFYITKFGLYPLDLRGSSTIKEF